MESIIEIEKRKKKRESHTLTHIHTHQPKIDLSPFKVVTWTKQAGKKMVVFATKMSTRRS